MEVEKGKVHAPEIGTHWINSPPLALRQLRGQVVLIDFWDYTCLNCLRTLPYVVEWHRRYKDKGLRIIGVHAPEFYFARTAGLVESAIARFGVEYPVVLDNDYRIFQAFTNKCWPAKYLIDQAGYIRFFHFGEGDYSGTELAIQSLLLEITPGLELPAPMAPLRQTDHPGAVCYRATPELYLGNRRGRIGNAGGFQQQDQPVACGYSLPTDLQADTFYLSGAWQSGPESIRSAPASGAAPSSILLYYTAMDVNLVMAPAGAPDVLAPSSEKEVAPNPGHRVEILQNGEPLSQKEAGEDVRFDSTGRSCLLVDSPRMYNLVRNPAFGQRLLQVVTHSAGLECFAFTFTTCVAPSHA